MMITDDVVAHIYNEEVKQPFKSNNGYYNYGAILVLLHGSRF